MTVIGSGFYDGGLIQFNGVTIGTIGNSTFNQFQIPLAFSTSSYNPGFFDLTLTSPQDGHSGGTSNVKKFAFLGNQNTATFSPTHAFQFDYAAGMGHKFRLSDGQLETSFSARGRGVAFDNTTSFIVVSASTVVGAFRSSDGSFVTSWTNGKPVMDVAARDGVACFTQDFDGLLSCVDLRQPGMTPVSIAIGDTPWNVVMTNLPNDGLVALVFNSGDLVLSVVKVTPVSGAPPTLQLLRFVRLAGLTSSHDVLPPKGGWQLAAFDSGPQAGKVAVLDQTGQILVWVDLTTAQEVRRVSLGMVCGPGPLPCGQLAVNPFRITADNVNGNIIVALADTDAGLTRFAKVASDGTVTLFNATVDFLTTGLGVSADGTKLYVSNRDQFRTPNNN